MGEKLEKNEPAAGKLVPRRLLGVVLAGGASRRFGGEKALFPLAGRAMAEWALDAVVPWTLEQVVITNDLGVGEALRVRSRPDSIPGMGPMGGLHTALTWAGEEGMDGVFLLACDLPLVSPDLVGRILDSWPPNAPTVVPGSPGPLGFEPLCGGYDLSCLPSIEEVIGTGRLAMDNLLLQPGGFRTPLSVLGSREELTTAFMNVNTAETARVAQGLLLERSLSPAGFGLNQEDMP